MGWRERIRRYLSRACPALAPKATPARPAPLAHHSGNVLVEVDVRHLEPRHLAEAAAALDEGAQNGYVASVLNVAPRTPSAGFAARRRTRRVLGPRGTASGFVRTIGAVGTSPSSARHLNSRWSQRSSVWAINVSMWARVMPATDVTPTLSLRKDSRVGHCRRRSAWSWDSRWRREASTPNCGSGK
jgi:hypothetical protein